MNLTQYSLTRRRLLSALAGFSGLAILAACGDDAGSGDEATRPVGADGATGPPPEASSAPMQAAPAASTTPEIGPDGHFSEIQTFSDGTKHLIPIEDIEAGGPGKDGIPSIDAPKFVGPQQWDTQRYLDDGLVIGVEVDGEWRAYPFQVLVWHELVNDLFNGVPLLVSYCPLCGSAIVFRRELEGGEVVEFGVSGRLYNSDLLMYDRKTDSLWSQITGTAVVGELTGQRLEVYPSELLAWGDWKAAHPDSEVLSRDTGHQRDYDSYPYGPYDEIEGLMFPVAAEDDRLHPKTRVTGVELDSATFGAYVDEDVRDSGPVNDVLGTTLLLIVADATAGGNVLVFVRQVNDQTLTFVEDGDLLRDDETGSTWNYDGEAVSGPLQGSRLASIAPVKAFWFAWFAFHQTTALWPPQSQSDQD